MNGQSPTVAFVFASRGIGGAEQSMIRLIRAAHPVHMRCVVAIIGKNAALSDALRGVAEEVRMLHPLNFGGLVRFLKSHRTGVAYLFGQVRTIGWAIAARIAGVRLVIGAERGSATRWINRAGRFLDRTLLQGYIANSHAAGATLVKVHGLPSSRVKVVLNGVALPEGPLPPLPAALTSDGPRVVCVANLRPNKGQLVLIRAVGLLRAELPGLKAWLVGEDMTQGALFEEARREGLTGCYEWAGFSRDVRPFLAAASVFSLPTLFREGMPTSILEAMSAGVPVIASDVGGVSDLVIHGKNGLLCPPGDAEALAAAVRRLLRDAPLAHRLADEARLGTVPDYGMDAMVSGHLAAFREFGLEGAAAHC